MTNNENTNEAYSSSFGDSLEAKLIGLSVNFFNAGVFTYGSISEGGFFKDYLDMPYIDIPLAVGSGILGIVYGYHIVKDYKEKE